ncbi:ribonuclease P protein subunit p25b [Esox lucius]|uniref:DNA/RNA-binding protein Alba-like domain-containing protein n=1 Tax=Esox lucius TaxID=8010 RepID=A0AAY5KWV8_ESOLU|nr:ribonuclease P protein subunit p25b [Esox lucius]XP_019908656.1 ribonuclease P protein subunit p25b [Esox lucius]
MYSSCGVGVASIQSQFQVRDSVRTYTGPGENTQIPVGSGVTSAWCPVYHIPPYSDQPTCTVNSVCNTQPNPLPTPLTQPPAALKPGQGGFKKVCRTEEDSPCPFPGLAPGVLEMRVKEGSKIRNLMGFAMARMQGDVAGAGGDSGGGSLRQVIFSGSGRAVTKTITCTEIMKRKVGCLHQLTKLRYKGVREVWESQEGGASEMTVHRTIPSISILLSKDPLDPQEPGYQPPETISALWEEREGADVPQTASKRPLSLSPHSSFPDSKRVCLGLEDGALPQSNPQAN